MLRSPDLRALLGGSPQTGVVLGTMLLLAITVGGTLGYVILEGWSPFAGGGMVFNPDPTTRIETGDTLAVLGEDLDIVELQEACR